MRLFVLKLWPGNADIGLPNLDKATVAGISVAIAGNVLISLALNFQKLAHRRLEDERDQRDGRGTQLQAQDRHLEAPFEADEDAANAAESAPAADAAESDYLLPTHNGVSSYGTNGTDDVEPKGKGKWALFSRFRRSRALSAVQKADDLHTSAVHTMMPVDIVMPVSNLNDSSGDEDSGSQEDKESDYLGSKLW